MEIKSNILHGFFKKVKNVETCSLNFTDAGLSLMVSDISNTFRYEMLLKKEAFIDYAPIGIVCIDFFETFTKVLSRFKGDITLDLQGNLLSIVENKKQVSIEVADERFDTEYDPNPANIPIDDTFTLSCEDLQSTVSDVKSGSNAKGSLNSIIFTTVEGGVIVETTGKYKFKTNFESPEAKGNVSSKFGTPIITACEEFKKGEFKIDIGDAALVGLNYVDETMVARIIVAPRGDN